LNWTIFNLITQLSHPIDPEAFQMINDILKPVQIPNLPSDNVKVIIIDARASQEIIDTLIKQGITIIPTLSHPDVYTSIAYHPDIMLHHIVDNKIVLYDQLKSTSDACSTDELWKMALTQVRDIPVDDKENDFEKADDNTLMFGGTEFKRME
jgi:hypothetical protein